MKLKTDFWNDDMKDVRSILAHVSKCFLALCDFCFW